MDVDSMNSSTGTHINWDDKRCQTCMIRQKVALANGVASEDDKRYPFMDELMRLKFGIDNCCTNHICKHKKLFEEMWEVPEGIGILGIGGVKKPAGIGTIVFQIADSMGRDSTIELENVLYIPDAPNNLIFITQWSEERQDNCGILSRGTYSIFMWKKDALHKLISHPISCKIPMMPVNEVESNEMQEFLDENKHCLHDQV
eukprot:3275593-Ditylum_brightwellii.AAC.3